MIFSTITKVMNKEAANLVNRFKFVKLERVTFSVIGQFLHVN